MAARASTRSRPFSPNCAEGFSLVEFLVALVVGSVVIGAALAITLASRETFDVDRGRTRVNQNLRSALDLVGIDLRQVGERLPADVPALQIANGDSGAPDTLIVQRNLLNEVLPLCAQLIQGDVDTEVRVADGGATPPPGCAPLPDDDANGFSDNLDVWRANRAANGGQIWAYVYNPVDHLGEYFLYDGDGTTDATYFSKGNNDPWGRTYLQTQQCRVYLLEQRSYRLNNGVLQFVLNEGLGGTVNLVTNVVDFQIRGVATDGSLIDEMDHDGSWTGLAAVEVTLTGEVDVDDRTMTRTVSARFFPRNILSN